jgi:cob(I)alamin adenosyltransferase
MSLGETKPLNRVLLFTGDGKGKTTAALGMALRACGHGLRVRIIEFLKADSSTGELAAFARWPNVEISQVGKGFVPKESHPKWAEHRQAAQEGLALARQALASGKFELVVLDEICTAVAKKLVSEDEVAETLNKSTPKICIVLTGRDATKKLMALADTVTEMRCIKHGMQQGIPAQKGVEY